MTAQIDTSSCPTPAWLPGGHLQTLYGALAARYHHISFVRERINTPDGDFLDLDWAGPGLFSDKLANGATSRPDSRLAKTAARRWMQDDDWATLPGTADNPALVLFHGLEGSSHSHYSQAITQHFRARGWIVVIAHFRSCSGFPNRMARAYYSGDSDDIGFILDTVRQRLPNARWHATGVSLGGNAMLKHIGEQGEAMSWLSACAAVSVPMDLVACGSCLSETWLGKHLYSRNFLKTMKVKILEKAKRFPGNIDALRLSQVKSLREFDDLYTAPMHGYKNALDYWTRASSKPHLKTIAVPTLVLNARNDPFIPEPSLPGSHDCSSMVTLHQPAEGGHVGFVTGGFPGHIGWLPARLARFFETRT
ncbi:alpha/beta fold hydrolase [Pollutimonas bauzanensis]|uniref:YheT family hydrolase n=1 Tax=Pollutimonas bauzanensis TaxID=658167 RepID=UPI003340CEAB